MHPACCNSQTYCLFAPVPHVLGYSAYLCAKDPESYTCLDQALADPHDVVPFGDSPYLSHVDVSILNLVLFPFILSSLLIFILFNVKG